jgi:hypothetical protein
MTNTGPTSPRPLAEILGSLHAVMGDERRAIARLDMPALETITACKRVLCAELAVATAVSSTRVSARERQLLARVRIGLGANAALIAAANDAIAAMLGIEKNSGYDRAARSTTTTRPMRVIAY